MALDPVMNFAIVTVSTGYDASATSIVLTSGHGAKLPSTFSYNLVWWNSTDYGSPADDPNVEIVRVTARSTDTLTVTRAQESTTAATHNTSGKTYKMLLGATAKTITDIDSNKLDKTGGTVTGTITLDENSAIALDPAGSADEKWSGITVTGTAGATLAVGDLCYLNSSWQWVLANASAASTSGTVVLGICLTAASSAGATRMLLMGTMRSAQFPASITGGAQLYVSATAGAITTTQPSTTDYVIRCVGWAVTTEPNTIYFSPSSDYVTHT
jgi:hypothetical protein